VTFLALCLLPFFHHLLNERSHQGWTLFPLESRGIANGLKIERLVLRHSAQHVPMDTYYCFFDRSAVDPIWKMSGQDFLRLYGKNHRDRRSKLADADSWLRELIAFSVEPEPSDAEVEDIIRHRTLRWTIQHSTPQFYIMGEILCGVPRLTKSCAVLDVWVNDFSVLLAAAAGGYFRGEVPVSAFKSVLKLHYSKFEDFIRLSKRERSVVRSLMDVDQFAKPIYPWQGLEAILDDQWAWCLGAADTKRFFALVDRLWKQNPEVRRILDVDVDHIEFCTPGRDTYRFRDFGISRHLMNLWSRKVRSFQQPCVFRRWE
jgi:hypothetical protein